MIVALVIGVALYVWYRVSSELRAERVFFNGLLKRLAPRLEPAGFHPTRQVSGVLATFEGPTMFIDVVWDPREREAWLVKRGLEEETVSAGERVVTVHLPQGSTPAAYEEASDLIVDAATSLVGSA